MTSPQANAPADPTPPDPDAARRRIVRFAVVLGVAAIVAVAAILVAVDLNGSSGSKPKTSATINAGPVVPGGDALSGGQSQLPELAIVLPRTDPEATMNAADQVIALRELIEAHPTAARYVDLGQAYMSLGDQPSAQSAFAAAAKLAPAEPDPQVGLAMAEGMSGTAGLAAANRRLQSLTAEYPDSQLVWFNLGWLALYRQDLSTWLDAWTRTVALGPATQLGQAASAYLGLYEKDRVK